MGEEKGWNNVPADIAHCFSKLRGMAKEAIKERYEKHKEKEERDKRWT
jgi:hypothetical protein